MTHIVITAAKRTAIGSFNGSLAKLSPAELGAQCLEQILNQLPTIKSHCDQVIIGNVLSGGHGQNIARQIATGAGLPTSIPSYTLNHVCGSGMQAIISGIYALKSGDYNLIIAGGVEIMSQAGFMLKNHRNGQKLGHSQMIDTLITDGLWDCFNDYHMGITAENVAQKYKITRDAQDEFALQSQQKATKAQSNQWFESEIIPITIQNRKGSTVVATDEYIRQDASIDALSTLKPAFKKDGTVTAGNASGINDGAAFVIITTDTYAKANNLPILATIEETSAVGYDPAYMGMAPTVAIQQLLDKSKKGINDIDLFEINEAFAAQSIAVQQQCNIPNEKLNVHGGAIALGHPIGASGARIVVTLCHAMQQRNATCGLASLCIGGGQATGLLLNSSK